MICKVMSLQTVHLIYKVMYKQPACLVQKDMSGQPMHLIDKVISDHAVSILINKSYSQVASTSDYKVMS